jgi:DNA-directed RNA polymerase subunit RPC12/RpoP
MEFNQVLYLLIIGVCIAIPLSKVYKLINKKCPECGGNLSLDKVKDPVGFNATKKITVSFYRGPRKYTKSLVCNNCSHKVKVQHWGT